MKKVIGINFNDSKKIYYFLVDKFDLNKEDKVIVKTEKGEQLGTVVTGVIEIDPKKLNSELKKIIRVATKEDISTYEKNMKDAEKALKDAKRIAEELELDMTVLDSSFSFDRKQLLFTFLADSRVDFRELVKKLAAIYKTRIELKQIGVRDKAKVVGGCGQCGRTLCCATFLRDLNSVSINSTCARWFRFEDFENLPTQYFLYLIFSCFLRWSLSDNLLAGSRSVIPTYLIC